MNMIESPSNAVTNGVSIVFDEVVELERQKVDMMLGLTLSSEHSFVDDPNFDANSVYSSTHQKSNVAPAKMHAADSGHSFAVDTNEDANSYANLSYSPSLGSGTSVVTMTESARPHPNRPRYMSDAMSVNTGAGMTSLGIGSSLNHSHTLANDDSHHGIDSFLSPARRSISSAKLCVLLFLVSLATATSWGWYAFASHAERDKYDRDFRDYSERIAQTWYQSVSSTAELVRGFSDGLNVVAEVSSDWPFASLPNWERRTAGLRRLTSASAVWIAPLVPSAVQAQWEAWAVGNADTVLTPRFDDSGYSPRELQQKENEESARTYGDAMWSIEQGMYRIGKSGQAEPTSPDNSTTWFAPIWQSAPHVRTKGATMFDQRSEKFREQALRHMIGNGGPVCSAVSESEPGSLVRSTTSVLPHVFLYVPVHNDNRTAIVAALTLDLEWSSSFGLVNAVPGIRAPLQVKIESTCTDEGGVASFILRDGQVELDGHDHDDDHHNKDHKMELETSYKLFARYMEGQDLPEDDELDSDKFKCHYRLRIKPTQEFTNYYLTYNPLYSAIGVGAIFLVTTCVFIIYDCLVEQRQAKVMKSAKRSNAIVRSLFPAGFRDRILLDGGKRIVNSRTGDPIAARAIPTFIDEQYLPIETPKLRLKTYLSDEPQGGASPAQVPLYRNSGVINSARGGNATMRGAINTLGSEPIADFFPNTTIMFADLAGFTAWSSTREPPQVFSLLESIYGSMDKAARKLGVFKVETVGDCYVAATGLPDPCEDHAVLMVRFANTCLVRISELTSVLETALGPGTADLAMRFGIHSGPVTAGVLRGEKSRFQLFGDTMNTAARMESTGMPNKIHLSKETTDLLTRFGKEHWFEKRKELVVAKGKGELQTYFLKPRFSSKIKNDKDNREEGSDNIKSKTSYNTVKTIEGSSSEPGSSSGAGRSDSSSDGDSDSTDMHQPIIAAINASISTGDTTTTNILSNMSVDAKANTAKKHRRSESKKTISTDIDIRLQRLIDWNVEVLLTLIKKIVARRSVVSSSFGSHERPIKGGNALEEVKEVIQMPSFSPDAALKMASNTAAIELPPEIRSELRDYIKKIACSYNNINAFHNFEHASHVALSANKLLKRIVMPDSVDYRQNSKQKETEKLKAIAKDLHQHTYGISSDPVTQFAVVFSALIHDAGHTGVPNGQLAKEEPDTAAKYRHKSIAEQRSVDIAWEILMQPGYEILRSCIFPSDIEVMHFRQLIVHSVLATDIFDKELGALRKARWQRAFYGNDNGYVGEKCDAKAGLAGLEQLKDEAIDRKATIVIEHIIQASDVAHTMQHWHVYIKWNEKLFREMFSAYKAGRSDKDPSDGWYEGELWFFDNYVIPLAKKLKECGVFGVSSAEYLNYAVENRAEWERKGEEHVERLIVSVLEEVE